MSDNSTRYYSSTQEKKVADYLGGELTPNSGAGKFKKGDILIPGTIIECKTKVREATQVTIRKDWIMDLRLECLSMGRPSWSIIFDFGTQKIQDQYAIIPIADYKEYLELKKEV